MSFNPENFVVDKILRMKIGYARCPKCDFDNNKDSLDICPVCGENLLLDKWNEVQLNDH